MKQGLVSVIMSTYNEPEEWLRNAIDSILNQSYKTLEFIIVCDNPMNEKSIRILKAYEENDNRVKIIINKNNLGLSKSLNVALKECSGEFIARMDADDISMETRIEEQLKYLKDTKLDLCGTGIICIDEKYREISEMNSFPNNHDKLIKKVTYNNCMAHPTWLGRSNVFLQLDGYREIPFAEDYDFLLRALANDFKLANINKLLLKYRIRSNSISNKNGLKQFLVSRVLADFFTKGDICKESEVLLTEINKEFEKISPQDEAKYLEASKVFTDAAFKLKNMNVLGVGHLVKAVFMSKYYRRKIMCYARGIL